MVNTSKNTDEKQRAYKKAKKLRRKIRKAEELKRRNENGVQDEELPSKSDNNLKWCRVGNEDAKKAVDRPLDQGYDEDRINEMLEKRSAAKIEKNYKVSDEITKTLVKLQIIYDDDKKQWHTRQWKSNNF
jgi:cysteinyl-tRNA synthetase